MQESRHKKRRACYLHLFTTFHLSRKPNALYISSGSIKVSGLSLLPWQPKCLGHKYCVKRGKSQKAQLIFLTDVLPLYHKLYRSLFMAANNLAEKVPASKIHQIIITVALAEIGIVTVSMCLHVWQSSVYQYMCCWGKEPDTGPERTMEIKPNVWYEQPLSLEKSSKQTSGASLPTKKAITAVLDSGFSVKSLLN